MTPEEFAVKMQELFKGNYDFEASHADADKIMCDLLESLGYKEGVDIFRKADKWYA